MLTIIVSMKRIILFLVIAVPSAIALPALYTWIFEGKALLIESISVLETEHIKSYEIQEYTKDFIGRPFYGVDLQAIARAVRKHPWVKGVSVHRVPPHQIAIEAKERIAVALTESKMLLDEQGDAFLHASSSQVESLPIIKTKNKQNDFKQAAMAILAYRASQSLAGRMKRVEIDDDGCLHVYFENDLYVELGDDKYVERWQKLDAILNHLRKDSLHPDYIYLGNYPNPQQVAVKLRMENDSRGFE